MTAAGALVSGVAGPASFAVAWLVLRNAPALGLIAEPNARSSHTRPTPSGGGLGIVAGGLIAALPALLDSFWPVVVVVAASLAIAAIGFLDDRRPLPARLRLGAQIVLVAALFAAVPLARLGAALGLEDLGPLLAVPLVLAAVYWINIFNFMDGIDGLAASEAAFILGAAAVLSLAAPGATGDPHLWWMVGLAAAALGFLLLNFPPARIFMGDAGSTCLGFMIAFFALWTIAAEWLSLWQWAILVALFAADATVTLLRRLLQGERVYEAHRRHAYQVLSRRWRGHLPVTLLAMALNVVWLLPLAWWAGALPEAAWIAALLAYGPLVAAALVVGAGAPEKLSA